MNPILARTLNVVLFPLLVGAFICMLVDTATRTALQSHRGEGR